MVAVARHERSLAIRGESHMTWAGLGVPELDLAGGRHRLPGDGEHRHRALRSIGHQRQRTGPVDRHAVRAKASLKRGEHGRWRALQVDDGHLIVGHKTLRVGGIELARCRNQRDRLVARDRDALWGADHARRRLDLADDFGRAHAQVEDGDRVGHRVVGADRCVVDERSMAVVGRNRQLRAGGVRQEKQAGERGRKPSDPNRPTHVHLLHSEDLRIGS